MEIVIVIVLGLALTSLLAIGAENSCRWLGAQIQKKASGSNRAIAAKLPPSQAIQDIGQHYWDDTAYYQQGLIHFQRGNEQGAIQEYDQSLRLNPYNGNAYYHRGVARLTLGQVRAAIQDFDRAIELDPDHSQAYYQRGAAYYTLANGPQAIASFQKAAQLFLAQGNIADYHRVLLVLARIQP